MNPSVCLSAPISVASAEWIYAKLDFGHFLKNLLNSKFGYNQAEILSALHEDLSCFIVAGDIKSP